MVIANMAAAEAATSDAIGVRAGASG